MSRKPACGRALGLVPQDVVLFNDTIRYNIAYGKPDATQAELDEAARSAQLLHFIEALPQGWETRVGERGLKLSGGEKQRVGIARVVLKNPAILILDEATSSLDSVTEADVQSALEDGVARAHDACRRAPPLDHCRADQIVVLDAGRVVERGTHAALIAQGRPLRRSLETPGGRTAECCSGVTPLLPFSAARSKVRPH